MTRNTRITTTIIAIGLLALAPAAEARAAVSPCSTTDHRCQARDFAAQAAASSEPSRRALFGHASFEAYVALYDRTGSLDDLCAAKRASWRTLRVAGLSDEQKKPYQRARKEFIARTPSTRCANGRAQPAEAASKPEPTPSPTGQAVASGVPAQNDPNAQAQSTASANRQIETSAEVGSPSPRRAEQLNNASAVTDLTPPTGPTRRPSPLSLKTTASDPSLDRKMTRPGTPLLLAGGLAFAAGSTFGGLALYARQRALNIHADGLELHASTEAQPTDSERAKDQALKNEYAAMRSLAVGTAITSGVLLTAAVVLVGVGGRRLSRSRRVAWLPTGRGLAFRARF